MYPSSLTGWYHTCMQVRLKISRWSHDEEDAAQMEDGSVRHPRVGLLGSETANDRYSAKHLLHKVCE
jgi:hypothetical protein